MPDATSTVAEFARRLMRCPASPYHEHAVRAEAEHICQEHELACDIDSRGNLLVRLQTDWRLRPLALAAHLDHPGFEIISRKAGHRWEARFLGSVPRECFRPGIALRLMPGGERARLGKALKGWKGFEVFALRPVRSKPEFAVWELEDFSLSRGQLMGRACDDLIGCATILSVLVELKRRRARVNVIGVLTRAEEIGFLGALTVAAARRIPKSSLVISLECSKEIPPVKIGRGVIIRVGDKTSIFDSAATRFLLEVAAGLKKRDASFQFQRALMSGGTCEATAYQEFGYQTTAVCVALGNYHNYGPRRRIAAEFISVADAAGMVRLLAKAAINMKQFPQLVGLLPRRLSKLLREAEKALATR
jgi:endoglucanase